MIETDWLAECLFMFGGYSIWCAQQGSFKSLLALLVCCALLEADQNPGKEATFLGRRINAARRDPKDKRPLRIYFLDNDSPRSLTERNCTLVGLNRIGRTARFFCSAPGKNTRLSRWMILVSSRQRNGICRLFMFTLLRISRRD